MMPSIIYERLATSTELLDNDITPQRISESQSWGVPGNERPTDGYFLSISFEELILSPVTALSRGPRTCTIAVHHPWDEDRDYGPITTILNIIDDILLPIEDIAGTDELRVTSIRRAGRSGNQTDEGWKTITRTATYGVLYQEYAA